MMAAGESDDCFTVRSPKSGESPQRAQSQKRVRKYYYEDELSVDWLSERPEVSLFHDEHLGAKRREKGIDTEVAWCPLAARLRHMQTGKPITVAGSPMESSGAKVLALAALADDIRALDDILSPLPSDAKSGFADDRTTEQGPDSRAGVPRNVRGETEFSI